MNFKLKKSAKRVKRRRKKTTSCDICLILHGTVLLHAKHQSLVAHPNESLLNLTPTELAYAARRLLPVTTKRTRVALALPSTEFVATGLKLPAIAAQNLKNVVRLQLPTLLPGVTEPLLLVVQAPTDGEQTCALWMSATRAEELFKAFDKVGLFLNGILPRPVLALPRTSNAGQICDEDDSTITCLECSDGVIQRWLHLPKAECDEAEFHIQLDDALSAFTSDIKQERKNSVSDWEELSTPSQTAHDYAFVPPSAKARMAQAARKTKHNLLGFVIILLIGGIIGGIYYAINYEQRLEQQLTHLKRRTVTVRQLQAEVGEIEEKIGLIKNFPRQEVVTIFETLDKLIPKDSWITSFQIEGGSVKMEGYSPNPTALIEVLTKEPTFFNVQSGRAISERGRSELKFTINFKLKNFNLAAYWLEYFPNTR